MSIGLKESSHKISSTSTSLFDLRDNLTTKVSGKEAETERPTLVNIRLHTLVLYQGVNDSERDPIGAHLVTESCLAMTRLVNY